MHHNPIGISCIYPWLIWHWTYWVSIVFCCFFSPSFKPALLRIWIFCFCWLSCSSNHNKLDPRTLKCVLLVVSYPSNKGYKCYHRNFKKWTLSLTKPQKLASKVILHPLAYCNLVKYLVDVEFPIHFTLITKYLKHKTRYL